MSITLIIAAVLIGLTALVHTFPGGRLVMNNMRRVSDDNELTLYMLLCWHFITAFLFLGVPAYALAAFDPGWQPLATAFSALCAAMGVLFLAFGLLQLGTIWRAPQWTVLLAIAALGLFP